MNIQRLFLAGLSLLVISILSFLTFDLLLLPHQRSSASVPIGKFFNGGGGGPGTIATAALAELVIEKDWPIQMDVNTSDTVEILLTPTNTGENLLPTSTSGNHRIAQEIPIPVGTPGASLEEAFGRGYVARATANLVATTFDIKDLGLQEQSLNQTAIMWTWNISPKSLGLQVVNVDIEIQWKPFQTNSPLPVIVTQIWQTRIEINVSEPWQNVGLAASTPIIGFIGAIGGIGLTVPWLWERAVELVTKRRKKKPTASKEGTQTTQGAAEKKEKVRVSTQNDQAVNQG